MKHNPKYVTWDAYIVESNGQVKSEKIIPIGTHLCNETDWEFFKNYAVIDANIDREVEFKE